MAFKMNKPSVTQGTAGHKSATESHLKMSALKAKEDEGSSDMMLDYSYTPDPKAISYEDAYMKPEVPGGEGSHADFLKRAKAWNMKTYGTHNPTADAKKAGINKAELAKRFKASSTKTKTEPVKDTSTIKTKDGTITNTEKPGGGTKAKVESNSKPLNSSDEKGKTVIKDRPMNQDKSRIRNADGTMKSREVRAAEDKARREKEAGSTRKSSKMTGPKAPESKTKLNERLVTRTKSHTGATTKTVDRGGKVRRVVSKDAQGNKTVVKYDRKGNVKKTGKQRRAEKEANKDAERAEKKATYNTKKAEMNAKNARVKAEKIAKNNAEGDAKKANMNKVMSDLEKDVAASAMKKYKTKY
jgi:hypothetical protein